MNPLRPPISRRTATLAYASAVGSRAQRWAATELQVWSLLLVGVGGIAGLCVLSLFLNVGATASGKRWGFFDHLGLPFGVAGAVAAFLWAWAGTYWFCGRATRRGGRRAAHVALVLVGLHLVVAAGVFGTSLCWCLLTGHAIVDLFDSAAANHVAGGGVFLMIVAGNASLAHLLWCLVRIVRWGH